MLRLEEVKARLADKNLSAVVKEIGLSYSRVYHALKSEKPLYPIIEKLSDYLESEKKKAVIGK